MELWGGGGRANDGRRVVFRDSLLSAGLDFAASVESSSERNSLFVRCRLPRGVKSSRVS